MSRGPSQLAGPPGNVDDAVRWLARRLGTAGIEDSLREARLLVEAATGFSREDIVRDPTLPMSSVALVRLSAWTDRRIAREPITRITGERWFYGRPFRVTPDTLDPRPETETLVDLALDLTAVEGWRERGVRILDIGTGTGCIVLTLVAELGARARGIGVDVSSAALAVARENATRLELATRMEWQETGDIERIDLDGLGIDLVVSNPPYIPTGQIADLEPGVRMFDPRVALDGGADGLKLVRAIVALSARGGAPWFAIEVGAGQADIVIRTIEQAVSADIRRRIDLGGHTRCVAWKPRF